MSKAKKKPLRPRKPAAQSAVKKKPDAGALKVGQRVTVTAPGSFAARCLGTVSAIDGGKVAVRLDHKLADKIFPAGDLAAA